jgi:sugar lactone lactonase YvrE
MRLARIGLLVALAGCQSGALSPGIPSASSGGTAWLHVTDGAGAGHLYVSLFTTSNRPAVDRFRLVNGIPQSEPDRVYSGYGGASIAASSDGTLYVNDTYSSDGLVYAFNGGSTKPDRTIQIAYPRHCGVSSGGQTVFPGIATDSQGNLFVAVYTYDGGAAHAHATLSPRTSTRVPCNGVAIFAPNANGSANPIQSIGFGRGAFIDAIAVDAADNLYVGNYPHNILQYANAVNSPKRTRVFHTRSPAHVSSLAIDAAGDIFISNTNFGYQTAWIDRYRAGAKANGPPTSEIQLAGATHLHMLYSIAVRGRDLYAADGEPGVDLYHARKNGPQTPFHSSALDAAHVTALAVGP